MSPSEFQLRSALRSGEGEHVDADAVIARVRGAVQVRHERRVRFASVAAAVAVVGGIAVTGGIVLYGGRSGNDHTSAAGGGGQADRYSTAGGALKAGARGPNVAAPGPMQDADAIGCPATAPQLTPPGSGSTDQTAASGPLFSEPVESIKICAYEQRSAASIPGADGATKNTVLTGQLATELAASLNTAPTQRKSQACPLYRLADPKTLVIIGLSRSGKAMPPVTATVWQNTCNLPVTNGTAIRYNWSPPASLTAFLASLANTGGTSGASHGPPGGMVTASPIRS